MIWKQFVKNAFITYATSLIIIIIIIKTRPWTRVFINCNFFSDFIYDLSTARGYCTHIFRGYAHNNECVKIKELRWEGTGGAKGVALLYFE